jgi:peptidoglycan lytic transglycosylase
LARGLFQKLVMGCAMAGLIPLSLKPEASLPTSLQISPLRLRARLGKRVIGLASWYGGELHGSATASGEHFNLKALTAAHRTLPFGTDIKVTNLRNHKSVVLRVNDRGPNVEGRVVDVSRVAAEKLGFLQNGVARVAVQVVLKEQSPYRACVGTPRGYL